MSAVRCGHFGRLARGVLLVELLIALAITAMVGLGVASMMTMVGRSEMENRDDRSVLLRAHAIQVRLRSYIQPGLCVLDEKTTKEMGLGETERGVALWLMDDNPENNVHLTELRVVWFDEATSELSVERVEFPEAWSEEMVDDANTVVAPGSDYFAVMTNKRKEGHTTRSVVGEDVVDFAATFNTASPDDAERVALAFWIEDSSGETHEVLMAFGLPNHSKPGA